MGITIFNVCLKAIILILNLNFYISLFLRYKIISSINNFNQLGYKLFDEIAFKIIDINYRFSFKYNITKFEYKICFYNKKQKLIIPSHLTLYKNFHIFCFTYSINNKIYIKYIANIYNNTYYHCIEYININEEIKFGIALYKKYKYIELIK